MEARVLGSLVEKEFTTPDHYPLTLNSLVNACNQKSNRYPVVALEEADVTAALDSLRKKGLAYRIRSTEFRVPKYEHDMGGKLGLEGLELAVLAELMLRGPQTPGELRTRCRRMQPVGTREEILAVLGALAARDEGPYVVQLPRLPRQTEARWAHLMSGEPEIDEAAWEEPARAVLRSADNRVEALENRVADLEEGLEDLSRKFADFVAQFE